MEKWQSGPTFLQVKRRFPGIRLGHARPLLAHLASGFDALIGRQWTQAFQLDLNEIVGLPRDGLRELLVTAEDVAGLEGDAYQVKSSSPVVFLHIGAMKTGTTYLQQVLIQNKEALADHGYLFPGARWGDQAQERLGKADDIERHSDRLRDEEH